MIVSNALMITFLFRTGSTSHNMSSMSSHNMSGDMYARFPQRNEKKLKLNSPFNIRMIAEQTAAYQKQMWLSQLQVTNPQAYQVPYSPHPTFLSDSCWNNSTQPFAPLLEPVPEGVTVTEFSVTAQSLENCCLSKSLSWLALFPFCFQFNSSITLGISLILLSLSWVFSKNALLQMPWPVG